MRLSFNLKQRFFYDVNNHNILANLSSIAVGTAIGWTSPVSPKLNDATLTDTPLTFVPSAQQLSWIGALVPLGALIGIRIFTTTLHTQL